MYRAILFYWHKLCEKILLREEWIFTGSMEELEHAIQNLREPLYERPAQNLYRFATFEGGGLGRKNRKPEPLTIDARVEPLSDHEILLRFSAPFREEHFLIAGIFILVIIVNQSIFQKEWENILIIGIFWPTTHLFFFRLRRLQEEGMLEEISRGLKLRKHTPGQS